MVEVADKWRQECNAYDMGLQINDMSYLDYLQGLVDSPDSDILVLCKGDKIIGYMGIVAFRSPLSNEYLACEKNWFILPEHRGISSMKLLKAARRWAKYKGCTHLIMNASCVAGDMHDKLCGLYEKMKMKKFETSYIQEV